MSMWLIVAFIALALAAIPCGLFLSNLFAYRRVSRPGGPGKTGVSVLIPARNEAGTIRAAVESVLANRGVDLEVLVLDDHSTDCTAAIVRELAAADSRVRLIPGRTLPPGWCGKQFACHSLAQQGRHPLLVFMDADVRLAPDALGRMASFMAGGTAALASGVPRQATSTFLERLLIPLIHFVLLGFLPMHAMRRSLKEKFGAGCGQLFIAHRDAYFAAGGHSAIRASLHDGVKLPRAFRHAGLGTDLFDATDLAECRMYQSNTETWRGLGKNATEGLGASGVLPVMTVLLAGGQVLPFLLLAALPWLPANAVPPALAAAFCGWTPRLLAAWRFRQSLLGAVLHPLGVALLLAIQWQARWRQGRGASVSWKGRDYVGVSAPVRTPLAGNVQRATLSILLCWFPFMGVLAQSETELNSANGGTPTAAITLSDQFQRQQTLAFPRSNAVALVMADREGAGQISDWIRVLKERYGQRIDYVGVANIAQVPGFLRSRVRESFKKKYAYPVMLDWMGQVCTRMGFVAGMANVIILDSQGTELVRITGTTNAMSVPRAFDAVDRTLFCVSPHPKDVAGGGSLRPGAASREGSGATHLDPQTKEK